ncbi:hypothetical protein [Symbioplanes lichenis]|uniref:hypothetical protein n=1 Tax=Symbioplanes lichenis TaxID=1629072 RepID=UPI00273946DB|nr:hypothetical protein [Actinoplanes lichenis]
MSRQFRSTAAQQLLPSGGGYLLGGDLLPALRRGNGCPLDGDLLPGRRWGNGCRQRWRG